MKHKGRLLMVLLLTVIGFCSHAQGFVEAKQPIEVLALLKKQADKTISIQAEFREEKHSPYLKQSQISSGNFYYQKDDKMRWEQLKPTAHILIVNKDKVVVKEKGIAKDVTSNARMAGRMKDLLLGLVRGDFQTSGVFHPKVMENKEAYQVLLVPTDKRVRNYYEEIQLVFHRRTLVLQKLTFIEKKGGKTITHFFNEQLNQEINKELFSAL